jgi:hypothetical protein
VTQPVWQTPAGSLGTVPAGSYYQSPVVATIPTGTQNVKYRVIAGNLPNGMVCSDTGQLTGIPNTTVSPGQIDVVTEGDLTAKFAIRAYTERQVGSATVVDSIADRTFTITVINPDQPEWLTPSGEIGQFFDGTNLKPGYQLQYINDNATGVPPAVTLIGGRLPPGLSVSDTGLISGYIGLNPDITVQDGFDRINQGFDAYPFDFDTRSSSYNYQFTLRLTDGRTSTDRTFTMFVWSTSTFVTSTTEITADNTVLTASISSAPGPIILNTPGSIGTTRSNSFFAYQFVGQTVDGDVLGYQGFNLPPGLTLDDQTGWLYGYVPQQGFTENTYDFTIQTYLYFNPIINSEEYPFSLTYAGQIDNEVTWISPSDLGDIVNGGTSEFYVAAVTKSGQTLSYSLDSGSNSQLPQGLKLLSSGNIVGRVSFDTFILDNGTTTFDKGTTTFDLTHTFTVRAVSPNNYINVTKTFSITVLAVYDKPLIDIYIKAMAPQNSRDIVTNILEDRTVFPPDLLYRGDDPNFGLATSVRYNHIYGLNPLGLQAYLNSMWLNHYWKDLTLGPIKTARATDANGKVIYEVVYSEIVDTMVNSQGESVGQSVLLPYQVTRDDRIISVVYPNSLENMRDQMIESVGQASNIIPRWMLSEQEDGKILGFTAAWVIAYTKPGASGQVAYNVTTTYGDQLNLVDFEADRYELDNGLAANWDGTTQSRVPSPPESTTFDILYHYQTANNYAANGLGYAVGDTIRILGSQLGGTNGVNDCVFTVRQVNIDGAILQSSCVGQAYSLVSDPVFLGITGTNITGSGSGALWNVTVVPGVATVFDGGSLQFTSPVDMYTNTDVYDQYALFPRYNILDLVPNTANYVFWANNQLIIKLWINEQHAPVLWVD